MKGLMYAFWGATLWGLSSVCSDYLMGAYSLSPITLTMLRTLVAALCFCLFAAARNRETVSLMLHDRNTLLSLLVFGSLGLFLCQGTYIVSINITNAGTATVMQSLNIVIIPLVTWLFLKGKLSWGEGLGAALAFASIFAIATQGNPLSLSMPLAGLIWGLANGLSESFYVMYPAKLFERWESMPVIAGGMIVASACSLIVWLLAAAFPEAMAFVTATPVPANASLGFAAIAADSLAFLTQMDLLGWLCLGGVCVVGTFVAFSLFLTGVSLIGPVKSSLLGAMEPIASAALCALLLHTAFTGWDWLGLVLMVGAIFLVTLVPSDGEKA